MDKTQHTLQAEEQKSSEYAEALQLRNTELESLRRDLERSLEEGRTMESELERTREAGREAEETVGRLKEQLTASKRKAQDLDSDSASIANEKNCRELNDREQHLEIINQTKTELEAALSDIKAKLEAPKLSRSLDTRLEESSTTQGLGPKRPGDSGTKQSPESARRSVPGSDESNESCPRAQRKRDHWIETTTGSSSPGSQFSKGIFKGETESVAGQTERVRDLERERQRLQQELESSHHVEDTASRTGRSITAVRPIPTES